MKWTGKKSRFTPPSEERMRAWLAWLARGMQREGQTVFQIEGLQPSWLPSARFRWIYYLTSRLAKGVVVFLAVGHLFLFQSVLPAGVHRADRILLLLAGFVAGGIGFGLVGGVVDSACSGMNRARFSNPASGITRGFASSLGLGFRNIFLFSSVAFLLGSPFFWTDEGLTDLNTLLGLSALVGFVIGLLWTTRSVGRTETNDIQPVENLRLSLNFLKKARSGFLNNLFRLIFSLYLAALTLLVLLSFYLGAYFYLTVLALSGVLMALLAGFLKSGIQEMKSTPNQGISLSLRNGLRAGGLYGTCFGASAITAIGLQSWQAGTLVGFAAAAFAALWYGGLEAMQHYLLRFLLWRSGVMPRRYADFLDYAANELHLLQKVGGGYIFLHRYLLEHFAAMPLPEKATRPALPAERPV